MFYIYVFVHPSIKSSSPRAFIKSSSRSCLALVRLVNRASSSLVNPSFKVADLKSQPESRNQFNGVFQIYKFNLYVQARCILSESLTFACHCIISPILELMLVSLFCSCFCTVTTFFGFFGEVVGFGVSGSAFGRPAPTPLDPISILAPDCVTACLGWQNHG